VASAKGVTLDAKGDDVHHNEHVEPTQDKTFATVLGSFELVMLILYSTCTTYGDTSTESDAENAGKGSNVGTFYTFYIDIMFMIFIGFGFLMTFMRKYGYSAVGFNWILSAVAFQWSILLMAFFHMVHAGDFHTIDITVEMLIEGCFGAGACMITFGAVLGKISPVQMVVVVIFELVFYAVNFYIGAIELLAVDMGGSMFVHTFGAYFGLAVAYVFSKNTQICAKEPHPLGEASTNGDMLACIGSIFLWILWPSFNGALAEEGGQFRVVINTSLALNASCIAAYLASQYLRKDGRFDMVHIQNATLAGGVAVGSSSDLVIGPGGALGIGLLAGFLSVWGYETMSPLLEKKLGLHDTCGVHNLHGMPGILGALAGTISCAVVPQTIYGQDYGDIFNGRTSSEQPWYQLAALGCTLGISILGGLFTGTICRMMPSSTRVEKDGNYPDGHFDDEQYWEVAGDYKRL
jgi:ammonium transporter Rh